METTNFFSGIAAMGITGALQIIIHKGAGSNWVVSVMLHNEQCGDNARKLIAPLNLNGTAEELDEGFFGQVTQPVQMASGLVANMEAYMQQLEAPLGQVLKIPSRMSPVLGQRTMLFRLDKSKLLPEFLVNSILTEKMQLYLHSLSGGSTVHHLKVGEVKTILIQHPKSPFEQQKIQEILTKEDNAIEELSLELSKLQSLKTGLMQDLLSGKVRVNYLIKETMKA